MRIIARSFPETKKTLPLQKPQDHILLGVATIVAALLILPAMDAIAKLLSAHLSTLEIAWARFMFHTAILLPLALLRHGRALWRPTRPWLQLLRGLLLACSALLFFCAIARMPLANAMAVFFIFPLLILIVSTLLLGEPSSLMRWSMVGLGFVGAALAAQPTLAGVSSGTLFAAASAVAYASALLVTRRLSSLDPSLVTASLSAAVGFALFSIGVPWVWVAPSARDWLLMAAMGVLAAIGHFLIVTAHRLATASQLAPYGYTEIASAVVFGFLFFGDWPKPLVWTGIALIVASGVGATWREASADRGVS